MQGQKQVLVQQQRLNLSPQLVQSIKLMAMPFVDLRDRILEEVEKNPALEIVADPFESSDISPADSASLSSSGTALSPVSSGDDADGDSYDRADGYDTVDFSSGGLNALSLDGAASRATGLAGEAESDEHRDFIEGVLHRGETLQEHLLEQLGELTLSPDVRALASLVIQNLDHDGFHIVLPEELPALVAKSAIDEAGTGGLTVTSGETGTVGETGVASSADLASALEVVRALDPPGCATADFRESLLVQARLLAASRAYAKADPALEHAIVILERHFDVLEKGRPDALVKALSKADAGFTVDVEEAEDILDIVRSLEPFPGRIYSAEPVSCIVPDVIVKKTEDEYSVVINDEEIPVLGVSPFFMELENQGRDLTADEKGARDFARESVKEARWFIGTIERRNLTILKLARAIVVFQRNFFRHGPSALAPLRMKDVAEEIGMHEATVSRAANGKYLQCEWGLFELRYFFSNQVGSAKAGTVAQGAGNTGLFSKQGVKEVIRELVAASSEPLSDQKIADQLALRGIKIARRTVAKYRGELTIGSSFER